MPKIESSTSLSSRLDRREGSSTSEREGRSSSGTCSLGDGSGGVGDPTIRGGRKDSVRCWENIVGEKAEHGVEERRMARAECESLMMNAFVGKRNFCYRC